MQVTLSKYAGFCDGVERAYMKVKEIVDNPAIKKPIVVLGSLVHNADVIKDIESLGIKKIEFNGALSDISDKINKNIGTLVITAHGIGPKIFEIAKKHGVAIVDTTCPKVIKAQRLAKISLGRKKHIIIIGEKKHKEVQGIFRWAMKKAQIVSNSQDVKDLNLDGSQKIAVISQTTQNKDLVDSLSAEIILKYPEAKIFDTVCDTTKNRQMEAMELARNNDLVLVIGSTESSNSNRLWEIAKKINKNTYFIERLADIKNEWLDKYKKVGVTAGASSPRWIIKEVVEYLERI